MTNTLTLHVFCVYFLFPFSLFLCLLFVWVLTSATGIPLHSAAMPIAISYTPEQCQHHLLTLTTVFCCSCLEGGGGWCCSRVEPAYQSWIVGRVTYSLPLGRTISSPLLYKKKNLNLSLRLSRFLHFSLSLQGYRICSFQKKKKKKKKKKLCSKAITSDLIEVLSIKLDCEGERERETDRQFQKVSLPPVQHEASVVDKTIQTEREREVAQETTSLSAYTNLLQDRILEVQQRRGVPSCKHKTGTTVLVLTSHLPSASSKSTDITDQASFPSTDTVNTTKKNVLKAAERNRQRVPEDVFCKTKIEVFRAGRAPFSCWSRRMTALAWPWCTRTRASSPRRHFVSPCACSDIPHLSTFTWNGPLCAF